MVILVSRLPFLRCLFALTAFSKICVKSLIVSTVRDCSSSMRQTTLKSSYLGEYQEVPLKDLLKDVSNTPVLIKRPEKLKNKYFGLRHGESMANIANIISSDPLRGSEMHGLTITGKIQARRAAALLIEEVKRENLKNVVFLSSNFMRARETASETLQAMINIIDFEEQPFREHIYNTYSMNMNAMQTINSDISEKTSTSKKTTVSTIQSDIHLLCLKNNKIDIIIKDNLRERYFGDLDGKDLIYYNKVWPVDAVDGANSRSGVESINDVIVRISTLINELEEQYEGKYIVLTSHADTLQIMQTFLSSEDPRKFSQYRFKNGEVRNMENLPSPVPMIYRGYFK
mmetsp:Transcript_18409/g.17718  ORF Transcript_18409/g.17718 Transcript_18409/m.17718 type:complete len:343 (-) Transcript_18409:98-1126(-)